MGEVASVCAENLISSLLSVHALTNMHRSSGNDEYRQSAARWLPTLERQLADLRRELTRPTSPPNSGGQ
jgi:hypothetical protein